jgi:gluconate 2-dehydrogenase gamma chain
MLPENTSQTSRREFVAASAAALATLWLTADPEDVNASLRHAALATRSDRPLAWEAFTGDDAADVGAIAAQIIPTDQTPGAREAHVVNFIDHSLANWAAPQKPDFQKGLAALNAEVEKRWPGTGRFAKLASDHQVEILKDWDKDPGLTAGNQGGGRGRRTTTDASANTESDQDKEQRSRKAFFDAVRSATITGMFSNPSYGGNTDKMGWKLLDFDDRGAWQPPFGTYDAEAAKGAR